MKIAEDFDAFVAIVEAGSISEGARALRMPRATLSRQLGRLEERLGTRLLHRSTRRMVPTPAGETLYARARGLLDAAQAAVESVQRLDDVPRGPFRVSAAPVQTPVLGELLAEFVQTYPDVSVQLETTTRHVDLVADHVDVAFRAGGIREPSLIARALLRTELIAVASPAYLHARGTPTEVSQLGGHACMGGFERGMRPGSTWPLLAGGATPITGPLVTNDMIALKGAALGGLGIALLPNLLIEGEVQSGRLVPLLVGVVGLKTSLSLVWVEREFIDPKVRAFVEFAVRWVEDGRFTT